MCATKLINVDWTQSQPELDFGLTKVDSTYKL